MADLEAFLNTNFAVSGTFTENIAGAVNNNTNLINTLVTSLSAAFPDINLVSGIDFPVGCTDNLPVNAVFTYFSSGQQEFSSIVMALFQTLSPPFSGTITLETNVTVTAGTNVGTFKLCNNTGSIVPSGTVFSFPFPQLSLS